MRINHPQPPAPGICVSGRRDLHEPTQRVDQPRLPSCGLATTNARHIACETATFRLLRDNRKPSERRTSSTLDVAIEEKTIGAARL
jgi:hypothetical protein